MNDNEQVPLEQYAAGTDPQTAADVAASLTPQQMAVLKLAGLQKAARSGGGWFYWIAGFSVINTVAHAFGSSWSFVIGLGATQVLDVGLKEAGGKAALVILPVSLMVAAAYALFGYYACRRARRAFITGLVLYGLDTLIFLLAKDIMSVGFHIFAGYCIYRGLNMDAQAKELERQMQLGTAG